MASETNDKKIVKNPTHRIWYVDPNDVYGMSNDIPVTPDYTDLCISFDLQVETVPRTGYIRGIKNNEGNSKSNGVTETYHFFWTSYIANADGKSNYVSFTKGEEYLDRSYLTTYYTDINFNDFRNKDVVEGLGVESVNISFESYYTPTIKMRFVDVRGASLFGREEAIHTEGKITQDNIWGCFFTFPYPKFRLQVKGFYGEPVTYQLTCLDFRANFDSKVGSFIIDVTFVGYDYGVMSDIPTAYLIAAPYSTYVGMDYWNTQKNSERWRLTDGQPPSTLKDIRDKIKAAIRVAETTEKGESVNEGNDGSEVANNILKRNAFEGVKTAYENVLKTITDKNEITKQRIEILYKLEYKGNEYYMFQAVNNAWWKNIVDKTAIFYEKLNEFKTNYPSDTNTLNDENLVFGRKITKDEPVGVPNTNEFYWFPLNTVGAAITPTTNLTVDNVGRNTYSDMFNAATQNGTAWLTKDIENIKKWNIETQTFSESVSNFSTIKWIGSSVKFQILPLGKTTKLFLNIMSQIESGIAEENHVSLIEQDETAAYFSRLNIYQAAGLLPTIENVFKTIMCHLETFMQMVYECKTRIDNQMTAGDRTPQKLGIEGYTFQDYKAGKTSDADDSVINIPPWIAVSVKEPKSATSVIENDYVHTIGWVGDFEGEVEWEEAKLIDGLSLAWCNAAPKPDAIKESYFGTSTVLCLPTDIYADVFPDAAKNNPLALGQYLATRAAAMFGVVGYKQDAAEALGKADAVNMLAKVGVSQIRNITKSSTNVKGKDWKKELKEAPLQTYEEGSTNYDRIYAIGKSGCEGTNKNSIYTTENSGGNYRYCYTEAVVNSEKYGMVYVPEADESSVVGSEGSVFIKEVKHPVSGNTNKAIVKVRANLKYKSSEEKDECKTGRIYYKSSTDKFLNINGNTDDSCKDTFQDEAMFYICGKTDETESYSQKVANAALGLNNETIVVDEYEDNDITWRKTLKQYWAVDEYDTYNIQGIDEKKYGWCVVEGNNKITPAVPQFIFHSKLYYKQNEVYGINDGRPNPSDAEFKIKAAKCLLVLSSAGYDIEKVVKLFDKATPKKHVFEGVPYGAVLLLGGLLWRAMQTKDCIKWEYWESNIVFSDEFKRNSTLTLKNIGKNAYVLTNTRYYGVMDTSKKQTYYEVKPEDFDINVRNALVEEFKTYITKGTNGWTSLEKDFELQENVESRGKNGGYISSEGDYNTFFEQYSQLDDGKFLENEHERIWNNPNFANLTSYVVVTYGSLNPPDDVNTSVTIDKLCWEAYTDAFCSKLEEIANYKKEYTDATPTQEKHRDIDLKRAMYMYIKRLWDRWFMMTTPEQFKVENYMQNFVFMDSFYRNIGSVLHINCERLYEGLMDVRGESMLYQLLSKICTDHHCHFFAFPDYFGFGDDKLEQKNAKNKNMTPDEKLKHLFTPIPFSKKEKLETSNKYVVALVYDQSENITDFNDYTKDDFDIYGYNDASLIYPETFNVLPISEELDQPGVSSEERRTKRYGYNIPSFGVTFGRQNNHIFKNVNIGMSNPIATEQSINALSLIAERGGGTEKAICFYGQDLYPVYNGYSYDCTVEMMGDVQIMPLMYFQLLNMPMFRGTYMIYSVTHTMRPGDMTTTFKGMKLSKFALPFAKGWYTNSRMYVANDGTLLPGEYIDGCTEYGTTEYKLNKGQKEMLISNNTGITRNEHVDTYEKLRVWQTDVTVHVHTDKFVNGVQGSKYVTFQINKALKEDVEKIFDAIYNTVMPNGKYFVVRKVAGYNDSPPNSKEGRRYIHNNSSPNSKQLSYHAYGAAIDINWDENPLRTYDGKQDDEYTMRTDNHPVVKIFKNQDDRYKHNYTWGWGGDWKRASKDYMHFSLFGGS